MLIREVILENFMSYEYAKVPLNSGLNIVCGPNGAGKSSILLAISVALGQAYTERGRKLSDLIRWGENTARVTLTFNNELNGTARAITKFDTDYVRLTRYLNNDGNYWFEINFQPMTKGEVQSVLAELGINPNNMILIMHQHMMIEFSLTTAQQKLLMIEEAVGFHDYREKVLEAQNKLTQVLSEEESISNLLSNAEQTLAYWKNEYDKYQRKKELLLKKSFFEREAIWAQLIKQEKLVESWAGRYRTKHAELLTKNEEIDDNETKTKNLEVNLDVLRTDNLEYHNTLLVLEKDKIKVQQIISSLNKTLSSELVKQIPSMNLGGDGDVQGIVDQNELLLLDEHSELLQNFNQRLIEFQTQNQLLKHEADTLANAKTLLEKLMKDKNKKEETLQHDREGVAQLLAISSQLDGNLEVLDELKQQIVCEEARINDLGIGLRALVKGLPPAVRIRTIDDPAELAKDLVERLRIEIDERKGPIGLIEKTDKHIQLLTEERQNIMSSIRVWENEIDKLSKQSSDIRLFMEGKREAPQIQCDRCGSLLTYDQWTNHLQEIGAQLKAANNALSAGKHELKETQAVLVNETKELDRLHQVEAELKTIEPTFTQTRTILNDVVTSEQQLARSLDKQKEIITTLAGLLGVTKIDSIKVEQEAHDVQNEIQTLETRIVRLESELSNFEARYVKPQRDLVESTLNAEKKNRETHLKIIEHLQLSIAQVKSHLGSASNKRVELDEMISAIRTKSDAVETKLTSFTKQYQDEKANELLLKTQKETITNDVAKIETELSGLRRELTDLQELSEKSDPRIDTERYLPDIVADIKITNAHLALLSDISSDIEDMYTKYLNLFNELKNKVTVVSENRKMTLIEVGERKTIWGKILQDFLDDVNPTFQAFLERVDGTGWVKLIEAEDVQTAGIELIVGFKGAKPQVLDSYIHSGGERSTATMAFLLALQHHIRSPFRAVDEFDVHMDPRNREMISMMLLAETTKETENQYLTITPGQVTNVGEGVNVIAVQRVQNKSEINVMV